MTAVCYTGRNLEVASPFGHAAVRGTNQADLVLNRGGYMETDGDPFATRRGGYKLAARIHRAPHYA